VNPGHLFLGTKSENSQDAVRKNRWHLCKGPNPRIQGERHGQSKLTENDARKIIASDLPAKKLARQFGIGETQVYRIKSGLRWGHLHG
jgi:DNA invertase Pin-like site-specific DNA recombinase